MPNINTKYEGFGCWRWVKARIPPPELGWGVARCCSVSLRAPWAWSTLLINQGLRIKVGSRAGALGTGNSRLSVLTGIDPQANPALS